MPFNIYTGKKASQDRFVWRQDVQEIYKIPGINTVRTKFFIKYLKHLGDIFFFWQLSGSFHLKWPIKICEPWEVEMSSAVLALQQMTTLPLTVIAFWLASCSGRHQKFVATMSKRCHNLTCSSRKNPYPPHGRSLEIPRGRVGGVLRG